LTPKSDQVLAPVIGELIAMALFWRMMDRWIQHGHVEALCCAIWWLYRPWIYKYIWVFIEMFFFVVLIHVSSAKYLNDTWIFDTQDYKWRQVEFKDVERKPSWVLTFCLVILMHD
jgi:hypothetical protein